ncbi:lamin tail domain-containing protein [Phycicoccus sonneratiae]|uniref:Lamin tail domain-containing protein n=1 Tax=Phycicoccus sonneratiae TaxID=2807628 RepID=A0ABS2CN13_9MICO|nr:lamin tail domain-containing protein [Phycicoccus sonneraticus]MBM6401271.1 lamin tail domain-containing protein [Phycicoccus sonneraticus]
MRKPLIALGVAAVAVMAAAGPAVSASVDQTGVVVHVVDGDTVDVDVAGDGTSTPVRIRNSGLQTMELGECHADDATAVMKQAALGKQVRLTAANSSASSLGRPIRYVDATSSGTVDVQLAVITAGQGLAFPMGTEVARAATYQLAMQQAALRKTGLWDDDACGVGPSAGAKLHIMVMYEGDGDETKNVNAEWVDLVNEGTADVALGGWSMRTAAQDSFFFPAGTVLRPGAGLRLYSGTGSNTANAFHWGYTVPHLPNITATNRIGSGAYLFDPQGDLRAHSSYPCVYGSCLTPIARNKVLLQARYDAPGDDSTNVNGEYVKITSLVSTPVNLSWVVVQANGNTLQLPPGTVLPTKGSSLRVHMGKGTSTSTVKYWGHTAPMLTNSGGSVELRTAETSRIACASWGTGRC